MYNKFVKNIYYPFLEKVKGEKSFEHVKTLEESQWFEYDRQKKLQWEKLRNLLTLCARDIPYYRELFAQHNININDINSYQDFLHIPILTKDDIRSNFNQMINPAYKGKSSSSKTSGSTGVALEVFHTPESEGWIYAGQRRARKWFDIETGDRACYVWGRPLNSAWQENIGKLKARLKNIFLLSAFELSDEALEAHWKNLNAFKPRYIYGYASSVYKLAEYGHKTGQKAQFTCQAVFATAETLFAHQREIIEWVFNCPVAQEYGSAETGAFGYECPQKNLHISTEYIFVEFLNNTRPAGPHEVGEVIVTPLTNDYMPLLRYRLGDMGSSLDTQCPCGRGLPLMDLKITKVTDMIETSDGRIFSSELFDYIIWELIEKKIKGIKQFRVIQETETFFRVEIVKDSPFSQESTAIFKERMIESLGDRIEVNFDFVNDIPRDKSGKMRYFVPMASN